MRYVFGFLCVRASALVSFPGCGDSAGTCAGTVCPCTEQGILAAIAGGLSSNTEIANTLIDGDCVTEAGATTTSNGYNIESPGGTCGFDPDGTDMVNVSTDDLELRPLQGNGGPTETHALGEDSVAIDHIPAVDCEVDEDQRGIERPHGDACDVGAFELEVAP